MSASREEINMIADLLVKFANHRSSCGCFICRNLTEQEQTYLDLFWAEKGGRKL